MRARMTDDVSYYVLLNPQLFESVPKGKQITKTRKCSNSICARNGNGL